MAQTKKELETENSNLKKEVEELRKLSIEFVQYKNMTEDTITEKDLDIELARQCLMYLQRKVLNQVKTIKGAK